MPYVRADLDQTNGFTTNGASDITVRTANRLYASPMWPCSSVLTLYFRQARTIDSSPGKCTLRPAGAVAVPSARLRSLFLTIVQDFELCRGDPSRRDIHFMKSSQPPTPSRPSDGGPSRP